MKRKPFDRFIYTFAILHKFNAYNTHVHSGI